MNMSVGENKRIVFVLGLQLPYPCAAWRRVGYFARYLSNKGYEVIILCAITHTYVVSKLRSLFKQNRKSNKYSPSISFIKILNIYPYMDLLKSLAIVFNMLASFIIVLVIMLLRPRAVIVSVPVPEPVIGAYTGAKIINAKFIVDIRDPSEDYKIRVSQGFTKKVLKLLRKINFSIYRKAHVITTVTQGLAMRLAKEGIRAYLVPNGADLSIFRPVPKELARKYLGIDKNSVVFVYNGLIGAYYDLDIILIPLAKVLRNINGDKNVKLLIMGMGKGRDISKLLRSVRELNLDGIVKYVGVINKAQELVVVLSASDIGVLPRINDPFFDYSVPVKFYEYLACNVPVLATARKGSELEIIVNKYKLGIICDPTDEQCLIDSLRKIILKRDYFVKKYVKHIIEYRKFIDRRIGAEKLVKILKFLKV